MKKNLNTDINNAIQYQLFTTYKTEILKVPSTGYEEKTVINPVPLEQILFELLDRIEELEKRLNKVKINYCEYGKFGVDCNSLEECEKRNKCYDNKWVECNKIFFDQE